MHLTPGELQLNEPGVVRHDPRDFTQDFRNPDLAALPVHEILSVIAKAIELCLQPCELRGLPLAFRYLGPDILCQRMRGVHGPEYRQAHEHRGARCKRYVDPA